MLETTSSGVVEIAMPPINVRDGTKVKLWHACMLAKKHGGWHLQSRKKRCHDRVEGRGPFFPRCLAPFRLVLPAPRKPTGCDEHLCLGGLMTAISRTYAVHFLTAK